MDETGARAPDSYAKQRIALRYWLLGREWNVALEAMDLAEAHHDGVRKDGVTPEFSHQVVVAHYLRTLHKDLMHPQETIATAFLHDIREDYDIADDEIRPRFGDGIADAVDAMTKTFRGAHRPMEAVFEAIAADPIASVAKAADRIHNQHTAVGVFTPTKILSYVEETDRWFLPMLHTARSRFPSQEPAYENAKFVLLSQMQLLRAVVADLEES